jgi:hypothetical protein
MEFEKEPFVICAFFTKNTIYEDLARKFLIPNCKKMGLEYFVLAIDSIGSWAQNTCFKPTLAKEAFKNHPGKNIVLLDVDSHIRHYPDLFHYIPTFFNIGALILDWQEWYKHPTPVKELLTTTLFLRNNEKTLNFCNLWERISKEQGRQITDQLTIKKTIDLTGEPVFELPLSYNYIESLPNGQKPFITCEDPVIETFQISRTVDKR